MAEPVTHPAELAELDLFTVWTSAEPLADRFDPFSFHQRMAAYRQLIDATNHDELFGADNRRNPLWGLMFQHQWQFRTGRLGTHSRTDGRIDPDAPWGYGNYALSVLPWLGATEAGIVPSLYLEGPPSASRFHYAQGFELPAEFTAGVADWRAYFELVAASTQDGEQLRFTLWKAHKTCLDVIAARIADINPEPYSARELTFLQGWCRMVDYLWVAAWPTDFDFMIQHGMDVLPEELLNGQSLGHTVRNVLALARTPTWRYNLNLLLWKRVMRTREARDDVLAMLDAVFNPNRDNASARRRMIGHLLRP